jgi:AcrR family transcriptional regulator
MTRRRDIDVDRAARREKRRGELLDAAIVAIRRDGEAVSMEAIAAEAGVTKPIIYKHFGDRSGLSAAIGERFSAELVGAIESALAHTELEPQQLLRSTIDTYLRFIEQDPQLYRFLVANLRVPAASDQIGIVGAVGQRVALVLGEVLRANGRDSGAAEPWAYGIVGMVHLAGDWWVERRTIPRETLADYLTVLLYEGLGSVSR